MENMRRCGSCGRLNSDDAYFCEGCGNRVYFGRPGEMQPLRGSPVRRKGRNPVFYLLISVIGLGVIALGAAIYLHGSSDEGGTSEPGFWGMFDGLDDFARDLLWAILAWGLIIFGGLLVIGGIVITVLASAD